MIVLTPKEMKLLDRKTEEVFGLSDNILMENAGRGIMQCLISCVPEFEDAKKIVVVCGKGNNGGDGFCIARYLYLSEYETRVYFLGSAEELKGSALYNFLLLKKTGCEIQIVNNKDLSLFKFDCLSADIIVDAVFGTGFKGEIPDEIKEIFSIINISSAKVVSVDIPSGVDGETGFAEENAILADYTITFAYPKLGHFLYPGRTHTGTLFKVDIGIPPFYAEEMGFDRRKVLTSSLVKSFLPERKPTAHKGDFGRVFILSGSKGYTGAGCMTAQGALKAGAGLVYVGIPESLNPVLETKLTEAITIPLPEIHGTLSKKSIPLIFEHLQKMDVCAIGPGIGRNENTESIVIEIVEKFEGPLVLDADAIPLLKGKEKLIQKREAQCILTPHPGELGEMIEEEPEKITKERVKFAEEMALQLNKVFVLKGAPTIIADSKNTFINPTGNQGLATGGTGDVLTGLISGFLSQKVPPLESACLGVYIHGLSADYAVSHLTSYSLIATDLYRYIPLSIKAIQSETFKHRKIIEKIFPENLISFKDPISFK